MAKEGRPDTQAKAGTQELDKAGTQDKVVKAQATLKALRILDPLPATFSNRVARIPGHPTIRVPHTSSKADRTPSKEDRTLSKEVQTLMVLRHIDMEEIENEPNDLSLSIISLFSSCLIIIYLSKFRNCKIHTGISSSASSPA